MKFNNEAVDKTEETPAEAQNSAKSTGFDNVKNIIADKLHTVAAALDEKAADQEVEACMIQYGKQASDWLDQSAEYVRKFDYEQADASIREYIGQNPGRNLLIAGGVGLIIGAVLRRR